jgi:hypothetical protein
MSVPAYSIFDLYATFETVFERVHSIPTRRTKTMATVIANSSMLTPDKPRYFKVKLLSDGTPCIEGISTIQALPEGVSTVVYSRHGGRTKTHPLPMIDHCLYEVHPGDSIAVYEPGPRKGDYFINSYCIVTVGPDIVTALPDVI